MARLQKEKQAAVTTGLAEQPAFPARWVERLLRALPGDRACLPPSSGCRRPRHQRRGVGTTRLDRPHRTVRPHAKRALRPDAATASHAPRSVTIAKRPFSERETGGMIVAICPTVQAKSVRQTGTTGSFGMGWMQKTDVDGTRDERFYIAE